MFFLSVTDPYKTMALFKCLQVVFVCLMLASVLNARRKCGFDDTGACSEVVGPNGNGLCAHFGKVCRQGRDGKTCTCRKENYRFLWILPKHKGCVNCFAECVFIVLTCWWCRENNQQWMLLYYSKNSSYF